MSEADGINTLGFVGAWNLLQKKVHEIALSKGWYSDLAKPSDRNKGEAIALMHSELSEGLEALRNGNANSDKLTSFLGIEEELADTIIRIMDLAEANGYRIGEAMVAKIIYNESRPMKHGGKKF